MSEMAFATITAKVDAEDKRRFDLFCSNVGLDPSTVINLFVKSVLREHRLPIEVSQDPDPFYSEANQTHIQKSLRQIREGKVVVKTMEELEAMEYA